MNSYNNKGALAITNDHVFASNAPLVSLYFGTQFLAEDCHRNQNSWNCFGRIVRGLPAIRHWGGKYSEILRFLFLLVICGPVLRRRNNGGLAS